MSRTSCLILASALFAAGCENKVANSADVVNLPVIVKSTDRTIKFKGAGGIGLEGSLMQPAGELKGKHPAVLLLPGSGPTDRDGNQTGLKTDTLKQIAKGLAGAGIVSFRFDKRATPGTASQWPKDPSKLAAFFSWENHLGDALAAWKAMTSDPAVDPANCAILGHSEGGLITLAIAEDAKPKALVLAGTPGRSFESLIKEQLRRQLDPLGSEGKKLLDASDRISKAIKSSGVVPKDVPLELRALYNPSIGAYYQKLAELDPKKLASRFTRPVLVINGESDAQVSPERDAKPLFDSLRDKSSSQLVIVPLASHNLKAVKNSSEMGFAGEIVPDALDAILGFLTPLIGGKVPEQQLSVD